MAGRRPLSPLEERKLLRVVRRLCPRDRCLITAQWWTGFRISEILTLTVGQVLRDGAFLPKIGIRPSHLKGGYGTTRWIPVLPELTRALERHIRWLERHYDIVPSLPLFPSRQRDDDGRVKPICRSQADTIIDAAFARAGIADDGRLGSHTLRKTFARRVYENAGHDLMVLKRALNHSDVCVSQRYLEADEDAVFEAIRRTDFTRKRRRRLSTEISATDPSICKDHAA
jgi:integrase/recombinase XerD